MQRIRITIFTLSFVILSLGAVVAVAQSRMQHPAEEHSIAPSHLVTPSASKDQVRFTLLGIGGLDRRFNTDGPLVVTARRGIGTMTASSSSGAVSGNRRLLLGGKTIDPIYALEDPSNTFYGQNAGAVTTGGWNSFFGSNAGYNNSTGIDNSFVGFGAGYGNGMGGSNSYVGFQAGFSNTTGSNNSFFGSGTGMNNQGYNNSFFGVIAGNSNTTGGNNSFFGMNAGASNTTEDNNTFLGSGSDGEVGITNATAIGYLAKVIQSNSLVLGSINGINGATADTNVGIGTTAPAARLSVVGDIDTTAAYKIGGATVLSIAGSGNTFLGVDAGRQTRGGSENAFYGASAGWSNGTGSYNAFFGKNAGYSNSNGQYNSFFGDGAGWTNDTGFYNSYFGNNAHGDGNLKNATAIGYSAGVTQSNSLVLGSIKGVNSATADTNVGIGTTAPLARLHVQNGDIYVGSAGRGLILKSPDGTKCAMLSIDNSGTLVTTSQVCPGSSTPQAQVLYAAQFANGDGVISEVVLCNPSTSEAVSGQAAFFDNAGLPMTVGISGSSARSSMDFLLPPLGMFTFSTDGLGKLNSGSLQVSSDNSVAGFVRFNLPGIGVAGVGSSQPLSKFIAPVRGKLGSIYSGIAIQNVENSPVTISLSLRDEDGNEIPNGTTTVTNLPALGHLSRFIHELFPQAVLDDFTGSLTAEVSGGRIAATALELGSTAGQFTTLPVAPLN